MVCFPIGVRRQWRDVHHHCAAPRLLFQPEKQGLLDRCRSGHCGAGRAPAPPGLPSHTQVEPIVRFRYVQVYPGILVTTYSGIPCDRWIPWCFLLSPGLWFTFFYPSVQQNATVGDSKGTQILCAPNSTQSEVSSCINKECVFWTIQHGICCLYTPTKNMLFLRPKKEHVIFILPTRKRLYWQPTMKMSFIHSNKEFVIFTHEQGICCPYSLTKNISPLNSNKEYVIFARQQGKCCLYTPNKKRL